MFVKKPPGNLFLQSFLLSFITDERTSRTKTKNKVAPSAIVAKTMKVKLKYGYEVYNNAVNKFIRLKRDVFDQVL